MTAWYPGFPYSEEAKNVALQWWWANHMDYGQMGPMAGVPIQANPKLSKAASRFIQGSIRRRYKKYIEGRKKPKYTHAQIKAMAYREARKKGYKIPARPNRKNPIDDHWAYYFKNRQRNPLTKPQAAQMVKLAKTHLKLAKEQAGRGHYMLAQLAVNYVVGIYSVLKEALGKKKVQPLFYAIKRTLSRIAIYEIYKGHVIRKRRGYYYVHPYLTQAFKKVSEARAWIDRHVKRHAKNPYMHVGAPATFATIGYQGALPVKPSRPNYHGLLPFDTRKNPKRKSSRNSKKTRKGKIEKGSKVKLVGGSPRYSHRLSGQRRGSVGIVTSVKGTKANVRWANGKLTKSLPKRFLALVAPNPGRIMVINPSSRAGRTFQDIFGRGFRNQTEQKAWKKAFNTFVRFHGRVPTGDDLTPVKGMPKGTSPFVTGIGETEAIHYSIPWSSARGNTHWEHKGGDQGRGKKKTPPPFLVHDPLQNTVLFAQDGSSRFRFEANRGLVG